MNPVELIDLDSGERFPVGKSVTLGREGCEIVLDDDLVSRRHAAIEVTASGLEIADLGSRNGTFINGEPLAAAHALHPGDTVQMGGVRLRVELPAPAAVTKPTPVMRGDVPAPEPHPPGVGTSQGSAARRAGATAVSLALIAATAAALIAYFADRGF